MKLKVKAQGMAVVIMVFIFGGILTGSALGYWKTTGAKVPAQIISGEYMEQYDPAEADENINDSQVRGKTTFKELLDWGLTEEEVEGAIGEEMPDTETVIKDYCTGKSIEFSEIKIKLQTMVDRKK